MSMNPPEHKARPDWRAGETAGIVLTKTCDTDAAAWEFFVRHCEGEGIRFGDAGSGTIAAAMTAYAALSPPPPEGMVAELRESMDIPALAVERLNRDYLGELVRIAWVKWAEKQPDPKASWLVPYARLSEPDKEADRQIGVALARIGAETWVADNRFRLAALLASRPSLSGASGEEDIPALPEKPEHHFYAYALGLIRAQRRMLDRWSEGDAAVRQRLWRDLHIAGDLLASTHPALIERLAGGGETHPVFAFLLGEGELDGCSFGERPASERGNFWWRKHLRAALEERPTPSPDQWQDIESAPRDGTRILLAKWGWTHSNIEDAFSPENLEPDVWSCWWAATGFWSSKWNNWNDGVEPCGLAGPNVWMPIPPLPEPPAAKGGE